MEIIFFILRAKKEKKILFYLDLKTKNCNYATGDGTCISIYYIMTLKNMHIIIAKIFNAK